MYIGSRLGDSQLINVFNKILHFDFVYVFNGCRVTTLRDCDGIRVVQMRCNVLCAFVGRGYVDAVRNLEVTFRSLGGGSKEKMQEDWESIDLKKCLFTVQLFSSRRSKRDAI